jgi:C-terminal processing protease CtpA/Prc
MEKNEVTIIFDEGPLGFGIECVDLERGQKNCVCVVNPGSQSAKLGVKPFMFLRSIDGINCDEKHNEEVIEILQTRSGKTKIHFILPGHVDHPTSNYYHHRCRDHVVGITLTEEDMGFDLDYVERKNGESYMFVSNVRKVLGDKTSINMNYVLSGVGIHNAFHVSKADLEDDIKMRPLQLYFLTPEHPFYPNPFQSRNQRKKTNKPSQRKSSVMPVVRRHWVKGDSYDAGDYLFFNSKRSGKEAKFICQKDIENARIVPADDPSTWFEVDELTQQEQKNAQNEFSGRAGTRLEKEQYNEIVQIEEEEIKTKSAAGAEAKANRESSQPHKHHKHLHVVNFGKQLAFGDLTGMKTSPNVGSTCGALVTGIADGSLAGKLGVKKHWCIKMIGDETVERSEHSTILKSLETSRPLNLTFYNTRHHHHPHHHHFHPKHSHANHKYAKLICFDLDVNKGEHLGMGIDSRKGGTVGSLVTVVTPGGMADRLGVKKFYFLKAVGEKDVSKDDNDTIVGLVASTRPLQLTFYTPDHPDYPTDTKSTEFEETFTDEPSDAQTQETEESLDEVVNESGAEPINPETKQKTVPSNLESGKTGSQSEQNRPSDSRDDNPTDKSVKETSVEKTNEGNDKSTDETISQNGNETKEDALESPTNSEKDKKDTVTEVEYTLKFQKRPHGLVVGVDKNDGAFEVKEIIAMSLPHRKGVEIGDKVTQINEFKTTYLSLPEVNKLVYESPLPTHVHFVRQLDHKVEEHKDKIKNEALEFEKRGKLEKAREILVEHDRWFEAAVMFCKHNRYDEAFAIARKNSGQDLLIYTWSKELGEDKCLSFLMQKCTNEQAVEICLLHKFFDAAKRMCREIPEMKKFRRKIWFAEGEKFEEDGLLEKAQEAFVKSGRSFEALKMYRRHRQIAKALELAHRYHPMYVPEIECELLLSRPDINNKSRSGLVGYSPVHKTVSQKEANLSHVLVGNGIQKQIFKNYEKYMSLKKQEDQKSRFILQQQDRKSKLKAVKMSVEAILSVEEKAWASSRVGRRIESLRSKHLYSFKRNDSSITKFDPKKKSIKRATKQRSLEESKAIVKRRPSPPDIFKLARKRNVHLKRNFSRPKSRIQKPPPRPAFAGPTSSPAVAKKSLDLDSLFSASNKQDYDALWGTVPNASEKKSEPEGIITKSKNPLGGETVEGEDIKIVVHESKDGTRSSFTIF